MKALVLCLALSFGARAQVCGNFDLSGGYGFELTGVSTISGGPQPIASIGRLDFGADGKVRGTSSVNFGGLFLGNPITGTYSTTPANCSIRFDLQDDSGNWQHFEGKLMPGGARAEFHQTDPGISGRGVLGKVPDTCGAASMKGAYSVRFEGRRTITAADGAGNLSWKSGDTVNAGTYDVGSDCFVEINFAGKLRGIVVDGGRTVYAVQTDPGKVATATFTAQ